MHSALIFNRQRIRFVVLSAFLICDAMDQNPGEMTLGDDAKDKGRESTGEENSTWVRGGKFSKLWLRPLDKSWASVLSDCNLVHLCCVNQQLPISCLKTGADRQY